MPDLATMPDADLDALRIDVLNEQERRRRIADTPAAAKQIADLYAQAVKDAAPIPHTSLPDAIGPGLAITWTDGQRWRNNSGGWLPKTATPATYPLGWSQETGVPAAIAWAAGQTVKIGDLRTYSGKTYRCITGHSTQSGWEPPNVPALWTVQG